MSLGLAVKNEFKERPIQTIGIILTILGVLIAVTRWGYSKLDRLTVAGQYENMHLPEQMNSWLIDYYYNNNLSTTTAAALANMEIFMRVSLINGYNDSIKNVYIDLPFDGVYSVDDGLTIFDFHREVSLGEIKAKDKLEVLVYGNRPIYELSEEDAKVGFDNGGVRRIKFPSKVYGYKRWLVDHFLSVLFFLISIIIIFLGSYFEHKNKKVKLNSR